VGGKYLVEDITRTQLGLGLLLGWLVTPRERRIIGELRVPPEIPPEIIIPKVEIDSLKTGKPAIAIDEKETALLTYQEICRIDVPEDSVLSLEEISLIPIANADYARFKMEIGDVKVEDIKLPTTLTLPFKGRVKIEAGGRIWIGIRTTDTTITVKGNASILGILIGV